MCTGPARVTRYICSKCEKIKFHANKNELATILTIIIVISIIKNNAVDMKKGKAVL